MERDVDDQWVGVLGASHANEREPPDPVVGIGASIPPKSLP